MTRGPEVATIIKSPSSAPGTMFNKFVWVQLLDRPLKIPVIVSEASVQVNSWLSPGPSPSPDLQMYVKVAIAGWAPGIAQPNHDVA